MQVWIDADACPVLIKDILFKAAGKRRFELILVANHHVRVPNSPNIRSLQVAQGFDVADRYIVEQVQADDLVITADIPLAADVVEKGGRALNPRGTLYTSENIKDHLSRRNLMDELRSTGTISGGPAPLGKSDVMDFANALDRYLTKHLS